MRRTRAALFAVLFCGSLAFGCTRLPEPVSLARATDAQKNPTTQRSGELAPQAYANASELNSRARDAYENGELTAAEILAEQALAAYARTNAQARAIRAEARLATTRLELENAESELIELDALQSRVGAEAELLETRVRVARDTEPLGTTRPSSPRRERARWEAVATLTTDAHLACSASALLGMPADSGAPLEAALSQVSQLEKALLRRRGPAPIDQAIRMRARCLKLLTETRRERSLAEPTSTRGDQLLRQFGGHSSFSPSRDERGVVLTLTEAFNAQGTLENPEALQAVGQLAGENPTFPILIVLHKAKGSPGPSDQARGALIAATLRKAGATQPIEVIAAGSRRPLLPRSARGARAANERVEVVFVSPTW